MMPWGDAMLPIKDGLVQVKKPGMNYKFTSYPTAVIPATLKGIGEGTITDAVITPPTAQNLPTIEDDLRDVVERNVHLEDDPLRALCEQTIRNYDPCISCATHFLTLEVERC